MGTPQIKNYGPVEYVEDGIEYRLTVKVEFGDACKNGHDTFTITGGAQYRTNGGWRFTYGGCCHGEIVKHFPDLAHLIPWHLCSTDGPLHYVANTIYHAADRDCFGEGKAPDLDAARDCAVWPDATLEQLQSKEMLSQRLPALLADFKGVVGSLGFRYPG